MSHTQLLTKVLNVLPVLSGVVHIEQYDHFTFADGDYTKQRLASKLVLIMNLKLLNAQVSMRQDNSVCVKTDRNEKIFYEAE